MGNDDYYGVSVAFDGEHIAIGSQRHDDNPAGSNRGAVYIYQSASSDAGTGWHLQQKIIASDGANDDYFGQAVSIYKNTLVVGTYSDDTGATNAGSAYVFEKQNNRWVETQLLLSDDIQATDRFGYAVSVHENTITVAADV